MRQLPGEVMRWGERAAVGLPTTCSRSSITTSSTSAAPTATRRPASRSSTTSYASSATGARGRSWSSTAPFLLLRTDDEAVRRIHQVCSRLHDIAARRHRTAFRA